MESMDEVTKALQGNDEASRALLKQQSADQAPIIDKAMKTAAQPNPEPPKLQRAPEAPKEHEFGSAAQEWTMAMAVLAGAVGAFSRQHATTALNAFQSGVNGFRQGNKEAFDDNFKQWEAASKSAVENNKILQNQYKAVLDNKKLSLDDQLTQIQLIASKYHDQLTYNAASERNMILISKILKSQNAAAQKVQLATEKLNAMKPTADQSLDHYKDLSEIADEYLETGDKNAAIGRISRGKGGDADRATVNAIISKKMKEQNLTAKDIVKRRLQYASDVSGAHRTGTQGGELQLATNLLDKSLPSMMDAARKVGLSESTDLNAIENALKKRGSSQDLANFSTQLRAAVSDYALMTGRGRLTVHSDNEAIKVLNENMGITSLQGFVDAAQTERRNVLAGVAETRENLGGADAPEGGVGATVHWDDLK
jgi:hypothetical protein